MKIYATTVPKLKLDFSLSENPLGCSPLVFMAIKKKIKNISLYPEVSCKRLINTLSQKFKISEKNIVLGNGSEQLIDIICRSLLRPEDEAILPITTFPLFEKGISDTSANPIFSPMDKNLGINLIKMKNRINSKTKLIILCNPNNPTGKILLKKELLKFIKDVSPIPVLLDEVNIDFGGESLISKVKNNKNLLILRSFSKGFGLAGLRCGFLVAEKKIIGKIANLAQTFPIGSLSEEAAIAALKDKQFLNKTKRIIKKERIFLTKKLRNKGFEVINSESINLLIKVSNDFVGSKTAVELLAEKGVSVVNGSSFRGLTDKFIRISIKKRDQNKKFLQIIDQIIKKKSHHIS